MISRKPLNVRQKAAEIARVKTQFRDILLECSDPDAVCACKHPHSFHSAPHPFNTDPQEMMCRPYCYCRSFKPYDPLHPKKYAYISAKERGKKEKELAETVNEMSEELEKHESQYRQNYFKQEANYIDGLGYSLEEVERIHQETGRDYDEIYREGFEKGRRRT